MRRVVRGIRLKGLKASGKFPSGNVRYYYRRATPAIPLPDAAPNSPEFLQAYAAAAAGEPTKIKGKLRYGTGTIGAAVQAFLASDDYMTRATSTRARWRSFAEEAMTFFGKAKLRDLQPTHLRRYLARFDPHPANNRLKLLRAMGRFWLESGLIDTNPAATVTRRKTPASDGHVPWTASDVEHFRAHWPIGSMQRLALELMLQTGAAIGDAVKLGPRNLQGDWLVYTRTKSKTVCTVPLLVDTPPTFYPENVNLRAAIEAAPRHLTWLSTSRGSSRSGKAAGQWFSKSAKAAGVEKTAHGLRKYLAIHMAERGATAEQRMAILGHETSAQTRAYSKTADARRIITGTEIDNFGEQVVKNTNK